MNQSAAGKSDLGESGIVQRMRKSVRALPVTQPQVLLACSAGKDSVALAWILSELHRLGLLTLSIAHIHHGQHDQADRAVQAVEEIGRTLDVPVVIRRLEQGRIDAHIGLGLEEAMRRERYRALARIAMKQEVDCIALAHHQTDQTETILLHLMRGAGVDGLSGMKPWEMRTIPWWEPTGDQIEIGLWRPFLGESAEDVARIAQQSGLPIVEDPTNMDPAYRRNAIRHQILPVLENISEGSTAAIARSAGMVGVDAELLRQLTQRSLGDSLDGDDLSRSSLVDLPTAMQRRVVRAWLSQQLPNQELSADRIDAIVDAAERSRGGSIIQLGNGHSVTLCDGRLIID